MTEAIETPKKTKYPAVFWTANATELLERAAFYGMFISITLYLTDLIGFNDIEAGLISAGFSSMLYFLPTFAGAIADKMGFRKSLLLAFALLAGGYFLMGAFLTKPSTIISLLLIMAGGAFIKSVITGTVAHCSDDDNRAKAFSIFYMMVNIGSFSGKTVAKFIRVGMGLQYINFLSAGLCLLAFFIILFLFKNIESKGEGKTIGEIWKGFLRVVTNMRFMALIIIVGGFWAIQHQLYATMPKFVLRTVGESASPEWYANVNPLVVVACVALITELTRRLKISSLNSIGIALFIIPFSALTMSLGNVLPSLTLFGNALHPITIALLVGIGLQGFAECFLSPRFLEYASKQAPEGETALYMGFQNITSFFGNILGFGISGYLLTYFCPDPKTLTPEMHAQWQSAMAGTGALPAVYSHSHYIWYAFALIGFTAFIALVLFAKITAAIDKKKAAAMTQDKVAEIEPERIAEVDSENAAIK